MRRISDFASDVLLEGQRASPITIGREFRLYFLASRPSSTWLTC